MKTLQRASGIAAILAGGYATTAILDGSGQTFGEVMLCLAGLVVAGYGLVIVTNASRRLAARNGPATVIAGCGLAVVQWLVVPTGGFSGDELWNANPGTAEELYVLAGSLVVLGVATVVTDDRRET